jgi:hypothetical protein
MAKKTVDAATLVRAFKLTPVRYVIESAAADHQAYTEMGHSHAILRIGAILSNNSAIRKAADEAFLCLIKYTAVQCPYCSTLLSAVDNAHLIACPGAQERYPADQDKLNTNQCRMDYPDTQFYSWLDESLSVPGTISAVAPTPPASVQHSRVPAVVDKKLHQLRPEIRMSIGKPRITRDVPAVVQRKQGYNPTKLNARTHGLRPR